MNEVVRASLAGIAFEFDAKAYEQLRAYIDKLEAGYRENPDGREIIADIEARVVEIILSKQPLEQIVEQPLIAEAVEQLGIPEDFDAADSPAAESPADEERFPRRLYRNKDGAKLGGVCNGLGTFLDIDPVWLRVSIFIPVLLLIVLPAIGFKSVAPFLGSFFGAITLLYLILWIAIPLARTPRHRLEMRGEKVTASSIQRSISRETADMPESTRRSASVFSRIFIIIGQIILFGIKFAALVLGFALAMAALALLVAIVVAVFHPESIAVSHFSLIEIKALLADFRDVPLNGYVAMLLGVVFIPVAIVAYQLARLVFGFRNNRILMWVLAGGWMMLVVYVGVVGVRNIDTIKDAAKLRYSNIEFLGDHFELKDVESVTINGDTVLTDGKVRRVDMLIDKLRTVQDIVVDTKLLGGKFSININLDQDSTRQTIEIHKIINDSINGNN